jgi:Flp pilus assembly pilin Flp
MICSPFHHFFLDLAGKNLGVLGLIYVQRSVDEHLAARRRTGRGIGDGFMKTLTNAFLKLMRDESGGEVIEYALVAGLISVCAIAVMSAIGTKVAAKWTSVNSSL